MNATAHMLPFLERIETFPVDVRLRLNAFDKESVVGLCPVCKQFTHLRPEKKKTIENGSLTYLVTRITKDKFTLQQEKRAKSTSSCR